MRTYGQDDALVSVKGFGGFFQRDGLVVSPADGGDWGWSHATTGLDSLKLGLPRQIPTLLVPPHESILRSDRPLVVHVERVGNIASNFLLA